MRCCQNRLATRSTNFSRKRRFSYVYPAEYSPLFLTFPSLRQLARLDANKTCRASCSWRAFALRACSYSKLAVQLTPQTGLALSFLVTVSTSQRVSRLCISSAASATTTKTTTTMLMERDQIDRSCKVRFEAQFAFRVARSALSCCRSVKQVPNLVLVVLSSPGQLTPCLSVSFSFCLLYYSASCGALTVSHSKRVWRFTPSRNPWKIFCF